MPIAIPKITRRKAFLSIDSTWRCRWKDLWTPFAGDNEGYDGYIDAWDSIPWKRVMFDDEITRDHNLAAPTQYIPKYAGEIIGTVDDLIAILEHDGIAEKEITAAYRNPDGTLAVGNVHLRDLFFRDFNRENRACPIVFSRPDTHRYEGAGHLCDNSEQAFYCRADWSCDGTTGMYGSEYDNNFRADALWFSKSFLSSLILGGAEGHRDAKLVVYIIAAGSVSRIKINDIWHIVSPLDFFPPYGDPYGFCFRGCRAVIDSPNFLWGEEASNSIIVEHIAPRPECLGAQVIFCFEWTEEIISPRRKKMPRKGRSIGDYIDRWTFLFESLAQDIANFPDIQSEHAALGQNIDDLKLNEVTQERFKGEKKIKTAELEAEKGLGHIRYMALTRMLKAKLGPNNPALSKYIPTDQTEIDKTKYGFADEGEQAVAKAKGKKKAPSKGYAFGDIFVRWMIMVENLKPDIQPNNWQFMQDDLDALETHIDSIKQINIDQDRLKGDVKVKTAEQRALTDEGEKRVTFIIRFLERHFGIDAPELAKYVHYGEAMVDKTKKGWKGGKPPEKPPQEIPPA